MKKSAIFLFACLAMLVSAKTADAAISNELWAPVWADANETLSAPSVLTLEPTMQGVCLPTDVEGTVWLGSQSGVPAWPFRDVEGGTFTMGKISGDTHAVDNESPQHRVRVNSFMIGTYEVTQEQWKWVMGSNPSHFTGSGRLPVENVSWDDCQKFLKELNRKRTQIDASLANAVFRLPTEAEWEFAARGGTRQKSNIYSTSDYISNVGWYERNSSKRTHSVGKKSANELGIYDMTGNVWEWCSDWYGYYSTAFQDNPQGPKTGSNRVIRGGAWNSEAKYCRVTYRGGNNTTVCHNYNGLRLILQFD